MKLLFDENVSPKLVEGLASEFPGSTHVRDIGLIGGADRDVWEHAHALGFTIVSKDTDFRDRSFVTGWPPKVIWLDVGNAGTADIANLLRRERERVRRFTEEPETSMLILSLGGRAV